MIFYEEYGIIKTGNLHDALQLPMVKEAFGEKFLAEGFGWLAKRYGAKALEGGAEWLAKGGVRQIIGGHAKQLTSLAGDLTSNKLTSGEAISKIWNSSSLQKVTTKLNPLGAGLHTEQAEAMPGSTAGVENRAWTAINPKASMANLGKEYGTGTSRELGSIKDKIDRFRAIGSGKGYLSATGDYLKNEVRNAQYYTKVKDGNVHMFERGAVGKAANIGVTTVAGQMALSTAMGGKPDTVGEAVTSTAENLGEATAWSVAPHLYGAKVMGGQAIDLASNMLKKKPKTEQGVSNVIQ